jgi:hypothetical protein
VDGLSSFIINMHTADRCDMKTSDTADTTLLLSVTDDVCLKTKAAIIAFEANDEGEDLIGKCIKVDCIGAFSAYGQCSKTCGGGTHIRTFAVELDAANGGAKCQNANGFTESAACNVLPCPVDCVGKYAAFGECSLTCGGGTKTKTFSITVPAVHGGKSCEFADKSEHTEMCNEHECPVDCAGEQSDWIECSAACGDGTKTRASTVTLAAAHGGSECAAADGATESAHCNVKTCEAEVQYSTNQGAIYTS